MTIQPAAAPHDAEPLAWWVITAFSGGLPYPDTPRKWHPIMRPEPARQRSCPICGPCTFDRFVARRYGLGYPQGPHRLVYGDRLGTVWITPSTGVGCLTHRWGIYLTLGVGNMVTLDRSSRTRSSWTTPARRGKEERRCPGPLRLTEPSRSRLSSGWLFPARPVLVSPCRASPHRC
jgi:hypothetical protein